MPNLTLTHSANIPDAAGEHVLLAVNRAAAASGLFDEADIKTRVTPAGPSLIGTADLQRGFVHLTVGMSPRPAADEKRLADVLADALQQSIRKPPDLALQVCVEVQPVRMASYVKRVLS